MKHSIPLLFLSSLAIMGVAAQKADLRVANKHAAGRDIVQLVGACEYLKKLDCWDMQGKRNPTLTEMVRQAAQSELRQVGLGFRAVNRLVLYKTIQMPMFPKGSIGGGLDVEQGSSDIWLSESQRPGEKMGRIEEELRAQVVVAPKGAKTLSIVVRENQPLPDTTISFRAGAEAKVIGGSVKIVAIRPAKAAELSRAGAKKGWVVELSRGVYPTLLDGKGVPINLSASQGGAVDSMFFMDGPGPNALFFMTVDPSRVAKVKFQSAGHRLVEISGAPANPR